MQETIDSIRATIELAVRQGSAQARLALQPEELGGIRVHLSQTSEGLLARLVPETQAGAQALADGRSELHRSLSSLGVTLLRMDLGSHSHHDPRPREERLGGHPNGSVHRSSSHREQGGPLDQDLALEDAPRLHHTANGGLVNVLV
jgi:flagellar hook-length control protein FliK